jgi:ABC-type lipoprotein release transport system permease subunit
MVFGLSPIDLATPGIAAFVLTATAIAASIAPAWRAAHLDPVEALRVQ